MMHHHRRRLGSPASLLPFRFIVAVLVMSIPLAVAWNEACIDAGLAACIQHDKCCAVPAMCSNTGDGCAGLNTGGSYSTSQCLTGQTICLTGCCEKGYLCDADNARCVSIGGEEAAEMEAKRRGSATATGTGGSGSGGAGQGAAGTVGSGGVSRYQLGLGEMGPKGLGGKVVIGVVVMGAVMAAGV